jgi:hypothetical protein
MQTIEMLVITYPVRVRTEKTVIGITEVTRKIVNERIKSGEEITIINGAVSELMVSGDIIHNTYAFEQNYTIPHNPSTMNKFQYLWM